MFHQRWFFALFAVCGIFSGGCSCSRAPESPPGPGPVSAISHPGSGTTVPLDQSAAGNTNADPAKTPIQYYGANSTTTVTPPPQRGVQNTNSPQATTTTASPATSAGIADTAPGGGLQPKKNSSK